MEMSFNISLNYPRDQRYVRCPLFVAVMATRTSSLKTGIVTYNEDRVS